MQSRRTFISGLAVGFVANIGRLHAQEAWTHYQNERFGTAVDYQEFFEAGDPPANGDGLTFTSPEASFRVFGRLNLGGETPGSVLAATLADGDHAKVTYQNISGNRLTLSGIRGPMTYYEIYQFGPSGTVHSLVLEYPSRYQSAYDTMVARMAKSFSGP